MPKSKKWIRANRKAMKKLWRTKSYREKMVKAATKAMSKTAKKLWKDPIYREKHIEIGSKSMERLRRDPKWVKKSNEARAKTWTSSRRIRQGKVSAKTLRKLWSDPKFRAFKIGKVKEQWKDPKFRRLMSKALRGIRVSRPQMRLLRKLCRAGISGLKIEYQVGRYWIDIAHLPSKTAIEIDGAFWHRNRKDRDAKKDLFLKNLGWKVLRFEILPHRSKPQLQRMFKQALKTVTSSNCY